VDSEYQRLVDRRAEKVPVVDVLRDAIRQRFLPPGMPLIQRAVADALGVSRIPVREALQNLAAEGLVTFTGDGAEVTLLSAEEVDELYSLRLLLEPALAGPIVQNYAPQDLERLRELVAEMDRATETEQMEAWANANYLFHDVLYRASGRQHYHRLARQLLTLVEPYSRVAVFTLRGREQSQAEHHEMLDALGKREVERLRDLLVAHLSRAHRDLTAYASSPDAETRRSVSASAAAQSFAARLLGGPSLGDKDVA
jgi:DNA-binding GntR family transcriptional regulator